MITVSLEKFIYTHRRIITVEELNEAVHSLGKQCEKDTPIKQNEYVDIP